MIESAIVPLQYWGYARNNFQILTALLSLILSSQYLLGITMPLLR